MLETSNQKALPKSMRSKMKAKDTSLLTFMRKAMHGIIPIYQRTYIWQEAQCQQLWVGLVHYPLK